MIAASESLAKGWVFRNGRARSLPKGDRNLRTCPDSCVLHLWSVRIEYLDRSGGGLVCLFVVAADITRAIRVAASIVEELGCSVEHTSEAQHVVELSPADLSRAICRYRGLHLDLI